MSSLWSEIAGGSAPRYTRTALKRDLSDVRMWSISFLVRPSLQYQVKRCISRLQNHEPIIDSNEKQSRKIKEVVHTRVEAVDGREGGDLLGVVQLKRLDQFVLVV